MPERLVPPDPIALAPVRARRLGIDTHHEPVVVLRADSPTCRAEGFEAHTRVEVRGAHGSIIATLNVLSSGTLLEADEAGLSESAWHRLNAEPGMPLEVRYAPPSEGMSRVRAKIFGSRLGQDDFAGILGEAIEGRLSNVEIAAFLVSCANGRIDRDETVRLTKAMTAAGTRLQWPQPKVVDKHCIGGLPGNRTTPIVVAIAASLGLTMPKTSSRAITSPAGTADTVATFTRVDLDLDAMRRVVDREGGCMVWGGAMNLSPADDVLIRVERMLDIDSSGQLVASVLSKKLAAGSTHVLIDIPLGHTAKVRSRADAQALLDLLSHTAQATGIELKGMISDGSQPVGRGVGPALEAHDVLAVLRNDPAAPADLRQRALQVASGVIELGGLAKGEAALLLAQAALDDGRAWRKFEAICQAQGGLRDPGVATYRQPVPAAREGSVHAIDNRLLSRAARLAGAPQAPSAGLYLDVHVGTRVARGQTLFELHAESPGELAYALDFVRHHPGIITLED